MPLRAQRVTYRVWGPLSYRGGRSIFCPLCTPRVSAKRRLRSRHHLRSIQQNYSDTDRAREAQCWIKVVLHALALLNLKCAGIAMRAFLHPTICIFSIALLIKISLCALMGSSAQQGPQPEPVICAETTKMPSSRDNLACMHLIWRVAAQTIRNIHTVHLKFTSRNGAAQLVHSPGSPEIAKNMLPGKLGTAELYGQPDLLSLRTH